MRWLIAVLAAGALACNSVTPAPEPTETTAIQSQTPPPAVSPSLVASDATSGLENVFPVPWSQQHFGEIVVFVRDETGLVTGATKHDGPLAGRGDLDAE